MNAYGSKSTLQILDNSEIMHSKNNSLQTAIFKSNDIS